MVSIFIRFGRRFDWNNQSRMISNDITIFTILIFKNERFHLLVSFVFQFKFSYLGKRSKSMIEIFFTRSLFLHVKLFPPRTEGRNLARRGIFGEGSVLYGTKSAPICGNPGCAGYSRPRRLRRRLIGASRGRVTTGCHDKRPTTLPHDWQQCCEFRSKQLYRSSTRPRNYK